MRNPSASIRVGFGGKKKSERTRGGGDASLDQGPRAGEGAESGEPQPARAAVGTASFERVRASGGPGGRCVFLKTRKRLRGPAVAVTVVLTIRFLKNGSLNNET